VLDSEEVPVDLVVEGDYLVGGRDPFLECGIAPWTALTTRCPISWS
jgi:hypothetical protein